MIERSSDAKRRCQKFERKRRTAWTETTSCRRVVIPWFALLAAVISHDASAWTTGTATTRRRVFENLAVLGVASPFGVFPANAKNLPDPVDSSKAGTRESLAPILNLKTSIEDLRIALKSKNDSAVAVLVGEKIPTSEKDFKAIFDAYSDPVSYKQKFVDQNAFLVYYTKGFDGPGRPSIESDLPVKQTLQYGARNEAWVAWNDFQSELDYQRRNPEDADNDELLKLIEKTIAAINNYLDASGVDR